MHALIVDGVQYYAHQDGLGNVVALTDQGQAVMRTYVYDTWGALGDALGNYGADHAGLAERDRARFKGAVQLGPEVDFYYMQNRWYEPKTGRFLSEDPIGLEGGINLYAFAGNDPVNGGDPNGLGCERKIRIVVGADGQATEQVYYDCLGDPASGEASWRSSRGWGLGGLGGGGVGGFSGQACRALASPLLGDWPISSPFGAERSFGTSPHRGVDYAVPGGTPVYAMRAGSVVAAGAAGTAGLRIALAHAGGLFTRYLHLSEIFVDVGDRVTTLDMIGLSGATGAVTGPHLHVEAYRDFGTPLNPLGCL